MNDNNANLAHSWASNLWRVFVAGGGCLGSHDQPSFESPGEVGSEINHGHRTVQYTLDPRIRDCELVTALQARVLSYSLTCTPIETRLSRAEAVRDETC